MVWPEEANVFISTSLQTTPNKEAKGRKKDEMSCFIRSFCSRKTSCLLNIKCFNTHEFWVFAFHPGGRNVKSTSNITRNYFIMESSNIKIDKFFIWHRPCWYTSSGFLFIIQSDSRALPLLEHSDCCTGLVLRNQRNIPRYLYLVWGAVVNKSDRHN